MSEQQTEYDTDTDDTQPTSGAWSAVRDFNDHWYVQCDDARDRLEGQLCELVTSPKGPHHSEAEANARLIAAAGTAASELPDEYDPVTAIQALPVLVRVLETLQGFVDLTGDDFAEELGKMGVIQSALDAARQHTTQTDE
jgi:hypothetical protein